MERTNWTDEEIAFLEKWAGKKTYTWIAQKLGRTTPSVGAKARAIGLFGIGRRWTDEENQFILDTLGDATLQYMATKLNRTPSGVRKQLERLGVSDLSEETGAYRTYRLAQIVGVDPSTISNWINGFGLPYKIFHKTGRYAKQKGYRYIYPNEFWDWAEKNKEIVHLDRIERGILIPEPEWLDEAIENDGRPYRHNIEWTEWEDNKLIHLIMVEGKTQAEAGDILDRSRRGVQKRIKQLSDTGKWPGPKITLSPWTDEQLNLAILLRDQGKTYKEISKEIGRPVRGVSYKLNSVIK